MKIWQLYFEVDQYDKLETVEEYRLAWESEKEKKSRI